MSTPPPGPLDRVGSIKVKIGLLVGLSVVVAALVAEIGSRAGVPLWLTLPVTVAAALAVTQWLARGMTSPLRQMTRAATRMATGDYGQRVVTSSADEVGQLARAFTTMAADLATAEQQRRQLIATVSHELRTPLAAQRALLENLVDGVVRPDDEVLGSALAQSERLSTLVGDLLDLARVDGGAAALELGPVTVPELLGDAVAEARVGTRDVRYVTDVRPADLGVTGDAARLAQVVANLLDNAARHSPTGGTVTVRAGVEDTEHWFLEVADEGPGIPPGRERDVFARFGATVDDGGGGTGLGLAIASWVCELHGGTIAALPPQDGRTGARVRAVLPRRPQVPADGRAPTAAEPARAGADAPGSASATGGPSSVGPSSTTTSWEEPAVSSTSEAAEVAAQPSFLDGLFGSLWPEARTSTAPAALLGSLVVGAVAAAVLPDRAMGLGTLLVLLLGGALMLTMSVRRRRPWTVLSAVLCLALGSLVVLRAAEWLTALALLVVGILVTTALTGAQRFSTVLVGPVLWVLSAVRGLPLLSRTLSAMSRHRLLWPVLRTVAVSLVALVVFGGLFASGDAVFGSWVSPWVPDLRWDSLIARFFVLVVVGGVVLAGCYLALNPPRVEQAALPAPRPVSRTWEWLVPLGLVVAVFTGFVAAQATAMWGGHDYVRAVTGLTYAEYVHQGFGQLTAATTLTLATVALTVRKAPQRSGRDLLLLRIVLGLLCALTLVVVASALFRMAVYQQAFGYTVLRVLVDAFELWLGLVVVLVMVAGVRWSAAWLPRAALLSGAGFLLVIGLANPEAWVAQQNIERYRATGDIDTAYLSTLGADATPTITAGLPDDLVRCALGDQLPRSPEDVLSWNLGRAQAVDLVERWSMGARPADCP